jgi:hypothetical protein
MERHLAGSDFNCPSITINGWSRGGPQLSGSAGISQYVRCSLSISSVLMISSDPAIVLLHARMGSAPPPAWHVKNTFVVQQPHRYLI